MAKLGVRCFSVSLDGFGAGPNQDLQNPLGVGGMALHEWFFKTRTFQLMHSSAGEEGGATSGSCGVDEDFAARGFENVGAWILGRNMFGPVRGPWPDESWKGWWGDTPPYHVPVFVLTHYAREPLVMKGGTTFYFVTAGIEAALKQAMDSGRRKKCATGRRCGDYSAIPARGTGGRDAPGGVAGASGKGRELAGGNRSGGVGVCVQGACRRRRCGALPDC